MARRVAGILAAAAILGVSAAWIAGSLLIGSSHQRVGDLPAGLPVQAVEFPSTSGATLRGWMFSGNSDHGALILMHGLRANRLAMLDRARFLSAAGYTILLFDFQAHGESTGEEITFGYLEGKDARAAVDFIKLKLPNDPIGVIGVSMGGAAALLASPRLDANAHGAGRGLPGYQNRYRGPASNGAGRLGAGADASVVIADEAQAWNQRR
jgi:uncharacterized protein